jgi:hypothetical protein
MSVVTFGELVTLAEERLAAAEATTGDAVDETTLRGDLARLVTALDGMAVGVLSRRGIGLTIPRHVMTAWERAASEIHEELRNAGEWFAAQDATEHEAGPLTGTAATLAAATDLLATHHKLRPSGELAAATPWADALASAPVTRALTAQVARWSELLVPWSRWLAVGPLRAGSRTGNHRRLRATARHPRRHSPVTHPAWR